ncbi:MAG: 50S ribosomal protein L24 [Chloroflexi bacterium]|nr:50S ribosomal protein L24 [Chloroflexota bacterium]
MALARIRKGDTVVVLSGREKGKTGTVREVRVEAGKAIVQDVNISKRHFKPGRGTQTGIVDIEQPIQLSNLAPIDPKTNKPTRVRAKTLGGGTKVRVAVGSGEQIGKE